MTNFEFLVVYVYVFAIFTTLIKTKTISSVYRFFKLIVVGLFVYTVVLFFMENNYSFYQFALLIPLVFLLLIIVQTEFFILLKWLGLRKNSLLINSLEDNVKIQLVKSIDYLSDKKIGALITFEKNTSLEEYVENAYQVNAPINSELLSTIFYPNTPLHDGAVIIRKHTILCAGAYYPSSERIDIPKQLGSRHRAAIGISEVTDALTIVVSEQTGAISVAVDGYLDLDISKESLILYLEKHLQR